MSIPGYTLLMLNPILSQHYGFFHLQIYISRRKHPLVFLTNDYFLVFARVLYIDINLSKVIMSHNYEVEGTVKHACQYRKDNICIQAQS
jgi:hypothetical protein